MNLNKALWKLNYFFSSKNREVNHKYSEKMIELFKNNDVSDYFYDKESGIVHMVKIGNLEYWLAWQHGLNAEAAWQLWQKVKPILDKCNEERFK